MRGSVVKRGNRFAVKVELPPDPVTGKRRQKWHSGYRSRKEAEQARTAILRELDTGSYVEPTKATLSDYLDEWLVAIKPTMRATTLDSYRRWLEGQVVPRIGQLTLQQVDGGVLNSLYGQLLTEGRKDGRGGLSPRTVYYVHTILHRAFKDAVRWRRLLLNPCDSADPPRATASAATREVNAWDAATVSSFLTRAKDEGERWYAAWALLATTGARRGEVLGLRWSDVDLDAGRLSIQQSLTVVAHVPTFAPTKTAKGRRGIALDDGSVAALRSWKAQQARERLQMGAGWTDTGLVFTMPDGTLVHPESFSKVFDRRVAAWKYPHLTIHGLRHTWATVALTKGVHPRVVQERLGHSTIAITLQTYSHVAPSLHDDAARSVAGDMLR
jgi:integrase